MSYIAIDRKLDNFEFVNSILVKHINKTHKLRLIFVAL
jgi:hypothetical protein